eukprot:PITA_22713
MINFNGKHSWSFMLICLVIFSVNTRRCSSLQDEWWPTPYCNLTTKYTNDSTFVSNVNTTLNYLHVDISQGRFNTSVYGQTPNKIYALLQCRGDATVEECYNCSRQAKIDVLHYCGNYVGCNVWSKFCFLRYNGNYNFTGHMDTFGDNNYNEFNASADLAAYTDAARQLLSDLSSKITSGSATNRYASGSIVDSGQFHTIYGMAQCWGDISLADCKTCLSTKIDQLFKSNTGRLGARGLARSCIIQYDANIFFNPSPSPSPAPQINVPPASPPEKSSNKIPIIFGVIGGFLLLLIIFLFRIRQKFKYALFGSHHGGYYEGQDDSGTRENQQQASEGLVLARIPSLSRGFTVFEMETLIAATENFHDNNKLGEGGFGAVYKGTTPEGKEIAVKKLSLESRQGKKEFLNEVKLVAKVQHRNLVKLLGCCEAGSERLLVYEYLPNNSLDKILFIPDRRRQLDWQKRCNIILGITRGLLYLHEDSHLRIIHRDIKASNILLDKNLNPKIADFGLARLFEEDETSVGTGIAGTRGYMAPEYALHGQLSAKADVYSFGILLLELISGKRNIDLHLPPEMQFLLQWTWGLYTRGNIEAIVDPVINETCGDQTEVLRCVHIALLCTQGSPLLRPSMATVNLMLSTGAMMLSTGAMMLPDPTKPAFVSSVAASNSPGSSQHGSSHTSAATASSSPHTPLASNANVSISELEPR